MTSGDDKSCHTDNIEADYIENQERVSVNHVRSCSLLCPWPGGSSP